MPVTEQPPVWLRWAMASGEYRPHCWQASSVAGCGIMVWMLWSVLTVHLVDIGAPLAPGQLFSLIALAGLSGATLRMALALLESPGVSIWFVRIALLALVVALVVGADVLRENSPVFWRWQLLALITGAGGALAIPLSHGAGRDTSVAPFAFSYLGIPAAQVILPLLLTVPLWAGDRDPVPLVYSSGHVLGSLKSGSLVWPHSVAFGLAFVVGLALFWAWFIRPHRELLLFRVTLLQGCYAVLLLLGGLTLAAAGAWLLFPADSNGAGFARSSEPFLVLVVLVTVALFKWPATYQKGENVEQDSVFHNRHTWMVSALSVLSLGSLLGFSAAFPLLLEVVFGFGHEWTDGSMRYMGLLGAPDALTYAWMGPLLGLTLYPIGRWVAVRQGGARVIQYCGLVMATGCVAAAYCLRLAYHSAQPEPYFLPFLLLFLTIFAAAGLAYGAVQITVSRVFPESQRRRARLWLSALAAYGVFYIPHTLGTQLDRHTPEQALLSFAVFYVVCLLLNGWFYLRRHSPVYNP